MSALEQRAPEGGRLRVMNIHQATDLYLAEAARQGKSPRTRDRYRRHFEKLGDMYPHYDVDEVTTVMIRRYLDHWQDNAPATSAQIISMLRAFFGWLAREGIIPADPTERLERPKLQRPEEQDHLTSLSTDEVRRMLGACNLEFEFRASLWIARRDREICETRPTTLYAVYDQAADAVKFGRAKSLRPRVSNLNVGNPNPLEIVAAVPAPEGLETAIHKLLADHRVKGEWFRADSEVLVICELLMAAEDFHRDAARDNEDVDPELTVEVFCNRANEFLDHLEAVA